jgi:hypothetical protein
MDQRPRDRTLVLDFQGPFQLCGSKRHLLFEQDIARAAGIYLWAVEFGGGFLINYVGQTGTSFSRRSKEHMIQCMGGNYRICDAQQLLRGERKVLWNGMWRRGTRDLMPVFVDRYVDLAPKIVKYLEVLRVFAAPTGVDRRTRCRAEGAIAFSLREQPPPVGSFITEDVRYYTRRSDEEPIQVLITSPAHLHGLSQRLLA